MAAKKAKKPASAKASAGKPPKKTAPAKKAAVKKTVPKKVVAQKAVAKKAAPVKASAPAKPVAKAAPKKVANDFLSPLDDRIVVFVAEEKGERKTSSGLILMGEATEGENVRGTVRAVGRGHLNKKGKIRPVALKVGDEILFPKISGSKVQIDGAEMYIIRESEVLGVLN